jgi:anthranilate phosphoribosyltransferase
MDFTSQIMQGHILDANAAQAALSQVLSEATPAAPTTAFLTAIQMRGIHLSELRGFYEVLARDGIKIDLGEENLIDVCGTGGDGKNTFNISTLAAFVLAGAGIKVAKHGNSSATSGCGSSDILAHLGVKFSADEAKLRADLAAANICYLHAPLFQPALKQVAPVRKEIGFRTFFNLLGPLLNPARPRFQFIGVAELSVLRLYRYFLEDGPVEFAVVHSRDGYDEISLTGLFDVATNDGLETYCPEDLEFGPVEAKELDGGHTLEEAAAAFLSILSGEASEQQSDVVVANAAFAMRLMHAELPFAECRRRAHDSLTSGAALRSFEYLGSH